MANLYIIGGLLACLVIYLGLVQRAMLSAPPEAINLTQKRWTKKQMQDRLKEIKSAPIDVKKSLPPKTGRRYIVVGGSGKPTFGCSAPTTPTYMPRTRRRLDSTTSSLARGGPQVYPHS